MSNKIMIDGKELKQYVDEMVEKSVNDFINKLLNTQEEEK